MDTSQKRTFGETAKLAWQLYKQYRQETKAKEQQARTQHIAGMKRYGETLAKFIGENAGIETRASEPYVREETIMFFPVDANEVIDIYNGKLIARVNFGTGRVSSFRESLDTAIENAVWSANFLNPGEGKKVDYDFPSTFHFLAGIRK
jgi:hypothetical protein